ncbi:hypothetical protein EV401DRAFT_1867882 [Pisolithus croceorrhizus]|nr:hypothetical protein EV401DRAFT_1867882 [Pisolithus croceorrhizus]
MESGPLLVCTICLSWECHTILVIECRAPKTWDGKFKTFSECVHRILYSKGGTQLCPRWQHEEGCSDKHDTKHLCSGCRLTMHGASSCPQAQMLAPPHSL